MVKADADADADASQRQAAHVRTDERTSGRRGDADDRFRGLSPLCPFVMEHAYVVVQCPQCHFVTSSQTALHRHAKTAHAPPKTPASSAHATAAATMMMTTATTTLRSAQTS
jgi:hypothetical protein